MQNVLQSRFEYDKATLFDTTLQIGANRYIHQFVLWAFRNHFLIVFLVFAFLFTLLTIIFAFFFIIALEIFVDSSCLSTGNFEDLTFRGAFNDAFQLSWTTFSTVGYGLIAPTKSEDVQSTCFFIDFFCSLESFIGTIFSGSCAAVIYSKVSRFQKAAQVVFSDNMTVQFVDQLLPINDNDDDDDDDHDDYSAAEDENKISVSSSTDKFPVINFRIANLLHSTMGGEIVDANISLMANVELLSLDVSRQRVAGNTHFRNHFTKLRSRHRLSPTHEQGDDDSRNNMFSTIMPIIMPKRVLSDEETEEESDDAPPKMVFTKLNVSPEEHPFFKRVWRISHVLDIDSPLLTKSCRDEIKAHGNRWPSKHNTVAKIEKCISFDEILVSFSGISNASGEEVFAVKVYNQGDLKIGKQFVSMLYKTDDNKLAVDENYINKLTRAIGQSSIL